MENMEKKKFIPIAEIVMMEHDNPNIFAEDREANEKARCFAHKYILNLKRKLAITKKAAPGSIVACEGLEIEKELIDAEAWLNQLPKF